MGLAIFVVEDTEIVRKALVHMLKRLGHRVVGEASDIESAIAGCSMVEFDFLTCDLGIPLRQGELPIRLGGYKVAESVSEIKPGD